MSNLLRTIFEIHDRGGSAAAPFQASAEPGAGELQAMKDLTSSLQRLEQQGVQTYSELSRSSQNWSAVATRATAQVIALLSHQNLIEHQSTTTHHLAEQAKSSSTLAALKQTAVYKAIAATALGFQALGEFDFWAAAQDFASAALWGTIAGAQIAEAASGGGHGHALSEHYTRSQGYGRGGSLGAPVSGLATGTAGAAHPPSGNLTVAIMGDEHAGQWLASTLNTAVEQRGVQLTASRAMQSPYAQG